MSPLYGLESYRAMGRNATGVWGIKLDKKKDDRLVGIVSFHDIARSAIKDVAFENKLLKQYIKNWPA